MSRVDTLVDELTHWNPLVRAHAAERLGRSHDREVVPALIEALEDPSARVRERAAGALGELGDPRAAEALCAALGDAASGVRGAAVTALGRIGVAAAPALCEAVAEGRTRDYDELFEVLVALGPAAEPWLTTLLAYPGWQPFRAEAAIALGRVGGAAAFPYLVPLLQDVNETLQTRAAQALGRLGDPAAVPALIAALGDPRPPVRLHVVAALERLGGPEAEKALIAALIDPSTVVRPVAARALGTVGGRRSIAPLIAALEGSVGFPAAQALDRIAEREPAPELRAALPILRRSSRMLGLSAEIAACYRGLIRRIEAVTTNLDALPVPAGAPAERGDLPVIVERDQG